MPLPPLYGHEGIRNRLAGAVASGRLPQTLLFEGPPGVGKQRLALWLAQALLCDRRGSDGLPCGDCPPCKLVTRLSHPDLHWFVPLELAFKSGDADKQVEQAEEGLGEELAARRARPLYEPPAGLASHGIASIRLLLRRLRLMPAMGGFRVLIIGHAERLVPQPGADAAANALLKALEEPTQRTVFVLTSADAGALLPTIRSRVVRVRITRLSDSVVTAFAQHELTSPPTGAGLARAVTAAQGSIGRLLALLGDSVRIPRDGAAALLDALRGPLPGRYALALRQPPFQARGAFTVMLDGLLEWLGAQARDGRETRALVRAMGQVMNARELAQGNVNPQLLTAVLAADLAESP
ncbi:MAG: hypothetical protein ACREMR_03240 [Gemmatimonadales bacterium]